MKSEQPVKVPLWKRPLVWFGSIGTILVAAIATAFGTGVGHDLFSSTVGNNSPAGQPVHIDSAMYVQAADDGFTFAFPQVLARREAQGFNSRSVSWPGYVSRTVALGGAIAGDADVQIVLRGNSTQPAVIAGMRIVKRCKAPLAGTLLYSPGAAEDTDIEMGFNLNSRFPVAQNFKVDRLYGNFFAAHTISLRHGATDILLVHAMTGRQSCQFTYQLLVDTGKKQVTESITDNGKPFVVTAVLKLATIRRSTPVASQARPTTTPSYGSIPRLMQRRSDCRKAVLPQRSRRSVRCEIGS